MYSGILVVEAASFVQTTLRCFGLNHSELTISFFYCTVDIVGLKRETKVCNLRRH